MLDADVSAGKATVVMSSFRSTCRWPGSGRLGIRAKSVVSKIAYRARPIAARGCTNRARLEWWAPRELTMMRPWTLTRLGKETASVSICQQKATEKRCQLKAKEGCALATWGHRASQQRTIRSPLIEEQELPLLNVDASPPAHAPGAFGGGGGAS
jgi:hypothetical protein